MSEKWRWIGNEDGSRNRLVVDDGSPFGGATVLECGNLDAAYQDRIGRAPQLEEACEGMVELWKKFMADEGCMNPLDYPIHKAMIACRAALAKGGDPDA